MVCTYTRKVCCALELAIKAVSPYARIDVVSYGSGEDRVRTGESKISTNSAKRMRVSDGESWLLCHSPIDQLKVTLLNRIQNRRPVADAADVDACEGGNARNDRRLVVESCGICEDGDFVEVGADEERDVCKLLVL